MSTKCLKCDTELVLYNEVATVCHVCAVKQFEGLPTAEHLDLTTAPTPMRPTEYELRRHFGDLLNPDTILMRPLYTTLWAKEDGTLLWSWKDGYANIGPTLRNLVYLIGPKGSGKTSLAGMFRNAEEFNAADFASFGGMAGAIGDRDEEIETAVIVFPADFPRLRVVPSNLVTAWAKKKKLRYYFINLTPQTR